MPRVAPSIGEASSSPRRFCAALRAEKYRVRALTQRSRLRAVASRFDGSLMGEALIATLSNRLGATLRWWTAPASSEESARQRRQTGPHAIGTAEESQVAWLRALGATNADPLVDATPRAAAARDSRTFGALPEARPSEKRPNGSQPMEGVARANTQAALADLSAASVSWAERTREHPRQYRGAPQPSPLVAALRKWETAAAASNRGGEQPRDALAAVRTSNDRSHSDLPVDVPGRARVAASLTTSADGRASDTPSSIPALLSRDRDQQWWSARVDAIHARVGGSVLPAVPNVAVGASQPDELAFADTLGEVLRAQARLYGVDVI